MKIVTVGKVGPAEGLALETAPDPYAGREEVLIEVVAAGVGLVDILKRRGEIKGVGTGANLGSEVVGTIVEVGDGVDRAMLGRRVFAQSSAGGYAEKLVARASSVIILPQALPPENAIAVGLNALVAHFAVDTGRVVEGERVLVRGAGGGIGFYAVQIAEAAGARVTAISSEDWPEFAERRRPSKILGREPARQLTDEYDVILDPVGGGDISCFIDKLAKRGRYVLLGAAAGFPSADFGLTLIKNFAKSPTFSVFSMASITDEQLRAAGAIVFDAAARDDLIAPKKAFFDLEAVVEAHRYFERMLHFEKVVLRVKH